MDRGFNRGAFTFISAILEMASTESLPRKRRQSMGVSPSLSELRIWLLGENWDDKRSVGNLILQRDEFETDASLSQVCAETGRGTFKDQSISVIITPNLFGVCEPEYTQALKNCVTMSAPGPHVLLLILQADTNTEKFRNVTKIMNRWSDSALKHTIVLLIEGPKKDSSATEIKLVKHLNEEKIRLYKLNKSTDQKRFTELFKIITKLNQMNEGNHLILEIYESAPEMPPKKTAMRKFAGFSSDMKHKFGSLLQGSFPSAKDEAMPVFNLVLFGSSSDGKSSTVNTLLGLDESTELSEWKTLHECVKREGVICAHHVNLVVMPQLHNTSLSQKDLLHEAHRAMSLCSFNTKTFLLVLNATPLTDDDKGELEVISSLFDTPNGKFWDSLMIIFIYQGNRQDKAVTEFIHTNRDINKILKKCGNKYYILSIDQKPDPDQLSELLNKIYEIPRYSYVAYVEAHLEKRIQLEGRIKEMTREIRVLSKTHKKAENESQRSSTNCVRIVLIGKTGNGKSATGNTILNRKAFKSQASFKSVTSSCQREEGFVNGTPVTVVDTPGLFDTHLSTDEVKEEILKCISLLSPGPHVFLLVLRIGRFTSEENETLTLIKDTFGKNAGMFSTIIFTHGDELQDQTIESCLEESDAHLKKLVRDCGGRYHVIDNTKPNHSEQVTELLDQINRMVKKNGGGCYTNEMFEEAEAAIKLEMERILQNKKEEMEIENKRLCNKHKEEMAEMERRIAEQRQLLDRERKAKEEELRLKEEFLRNELKRRDEQEEKEQKQRQEAEEQRRREEERKQQQWENERQKIEANRIQLEEEQQRRDQEYREKYERERRELEELHNERLKRKQEKEFQRKLEVERSEWELKEKKLIEEFEQEKRKREEDENQRIAKEQKERERIERDYENSKTEMRKQKEEWENTWKEEWDKRMKEETERRKEEREKLKKLEEAFERERKEEEEKRKREDKARREQEERERKEMEEEYERKLKEMKRKYENEARKQAEEFNEFREKYTKDFHALMLKHDAEMQKLKLQHEKECRENEIEYNALGELSKQKEKNLKEKIEEIKVNHQKEVDELKKKYEKKCVLM